MAIANTARAPAPPSRAKTFGSKVNQSDTYGGHLPAGSKASFKFKAGLATRLSAALASTPTPPDLPGGLETYMFLFDTDTGALAAIMEVMYLSWLKTDGRISAGDASSGAARQCQSWRSSAVDATPALNFTALTKVADIPARANLQPQPR